MNAGMDPGKDGEKIRSFQPVFDSGDEGAEHGVKWWPDDED